MNVEELLKRHPELTPSPGLEARIERAARPSRRWMVPMAAALLLCAAVFGVVVWTPGGKGKKELTFLVRFVHQAAADCRPAHACRNDAHWKYFADGRELQSPTQIDGLLPKERTIVVEGPPITTWGMVRTVQRACVKAGIPRVDWRIGGQALQVEARPPRKPPLVDLKVRLEDITVVLKPDVRRVGTRKPVDSDEALMAIILQMKTDYGRAGKTETPIFIDAAADVSWSEIVRVIELCRKEGLTDIELEPSDPQEKPDSIRVPDMKRFPRPRND